MASETPSHLARKNHFNCFDYGKALQNLGESHENVDPEIGPFGLTFLGINKMGAFKRLIDEFETIFIEAVSGSGELRSQLQANYTPERAFQIYKENKDLFQRLSGSAYWYIQTSLKLASEIFWKALSVPESNKEKLHELQIKWLLHAEWAHLSTPNLLKARELLQKIKAYAEEAKKELEWTEGKRNFNPFHISEIAVPKIPYLSNPRSVKNPLHTPSLFPQFSEKYQIYISSLISQISRVNKSLAEAMLVRLELASESEDLQSDDVLFGCVKKIQSLVDPNSFGKLGLPVDKPRKTLNREAFQVFPLHILEFSDEVTKARLNNLKWMRVENGIPCRPSSNDSNQLCLTSAFKNLLIDIPSYVHPYDLALFNIGIHNIQSWNQRIFGGSASLDFKQIDFSTLNQFFLNVFSFIQKAALQTQPNNGWARLLGAKLVQALDFANRFLIFIRTRENTLNLNISSDYALLIAGIRDFCDFVTSNINNEPEKNKAIIKIFEETRESLIHEFFGLLRAQKISDVGMLENCLDLLRSCIAADHRNHVGVIQKLLFDKNISSITLQDIRKALESRAFNLPKEKIYSEIKLLLETAYLLRNKKFSPALVHIFQAFDLEFETSLVKTLTRDSEVRIKASIALLENVDFQLPLAYADILDALTFLSSINFHERILFNFIDHYLKHFKGEDFKALDMLLLVNSEDRVKAYSRSRLQYLLLNDPSSIIDDATKQEFERIFQRFPTLRAELSVDVTPLLEGFIQDLPRQIEENMQLPENEIPLFKANRLTPEQALEIVRFFLPSKQTPYLEKIDQPFYSYIEAVITGSAAEELIDKFLNLVLFNFRSFPASENFRKEVRKLLEIVVSRPWTPFGHQLCIHFDVEPPYKILNRSRVQILRMLLNDKAVGSKKLRDLEKLTPGLKGISEFYGCENTEKVLDLIEQFLQYPIYHSNTFDLLQIHLSVTSETSSQKFDFLSAQFKQLLQFQTKTRATLKALKENNFGEFSKWRDELHVDIVGLDQPLPAILYIYLNFLEELEDALRNSVRSQSGDKSKYIIQALKKAYPTSEKEIFERWLNRNKIPKRDFENYCVVLQRLNLIVQNENEILSIFQTIYNIKSLYASDEDWIVKFPLSRVDICLNVLSLDERRQLASALSLLNGAKYNIVSKDALSAFRRLLLEDTDNHQKDLDLLSDAHIVAEANKKFQRLRKEEERIAFREELQRKYHDRSKFLETLFPILLKDYAAENRKRNFWEDLISVLFPDISGAEVSTNMRRIAHSFIWGLRQISPEIFSQLFSEDGSLIGAKKYNRHVVNPVYHLDPSIPVGHVKFFPDSPGIQEAARIVSVLVESPIPNSELLKFPASTAGQQDDYPVLLSEHNAGRSLLEIWNRNEKIKLHSASFTREFLRVLLTRDQDGLPSNYNLDEVENSGTYRLVCIEDEAAFGDVVLKEGNDLKLMLVSAVLCCDEMNQPIDPSVRAFILSLDIFNFVNHFITDISHYNSKLSQTDKGSCFFDRAACEFWAKHKDHPVAIAFPFLDDKLVREMIRVLSKLQELVAAHPLITHIQILKAIYPELIPYYASVLKEAISPRERFDKVLKKGRGSECLKVHGSYISTRNNTQIYLSYFGHVPNTKELTRPEALAGAVAKDALLSIEKQLEVLKPVRVGLERGDSSAFKLLPNIDLKEKVLNGIQGSWPPLKLSKLSPQIRRDVFQVLLVGGFHVLDFSDCSDITTDEIKEILNKNPDLRSLNLACCHQLDIPQLVPVIASACPNLEMLRLSMLNMRYLDYAGEVPKKERLRGRRNPINHAFIQRCFNTLDLSQPFQTPLMLQSSAPSMIDTWRSGPLFIFRNLKHLYIDNCTNLESVALVAPSLVRLHARGCTSLQNLKILTFQQSTASFENSRYCFGNPFIPEHVELSCYDNLGSLPHSPSIYAQTKVDSINLHLGEEKITSLDLYIFNYMISWFHPIEIRLIGIANQNYNNELLESLFALLQKSKLKVSFDELDPFNTRQVRFQELREREIELSHQIDFFNKAAQKGFADAQYCLGLYYNNHPNFPNARTAAVKWFSEAAKQGHARAQSALRRFDKQAELLN